MPVLTRYLATIYLTRFVFLLICITAFILSLDLVSSADSIADRSSGDMAPIAKYAVLRVPQILSETIKYACLLAALLTLISLMRHNQLTPIWGGGISQFGMTWRLAPVAMAIGLFQFAIDYALVPDSKAALREWGVVSQDSPQQRNSKEATSANWIKVENDIVRIPHGLLQEGMIRSFVIFQRNSDGGLLSRLDVSLAHLENVGWGLEGVTRRSIGGDGEKIGYLSGWGAGFRPKNVGELNIHPRDLAFDRLLSYVRADAHGTWAPHLYRTWLQVKLAVCLIPFLMVFLVVALSQRFHRTGRTDVLFLIGLALGFAFFITNGIGLALGEVGLLPPFMAGWAATIGFAAITGGMAFSREVLHASDK